MNCIEENVFLNLADCRYWMEVGRSPSPKYWIETLQTSRCVKCYISYRPSLKKTTYGFPFPFSTPFISPPVFTLYRGLSILVQVTSQYRVRKKGNVWVVQRVQKYRFTAKVSGFFYSHVIFNKIENFIL